MYLNANLEGRLVNDPEFKTGKNEREFVTFRVAVNQYFGGQETATFLNCTGNEFVAERFKKVDIKKGRLLHIDGNLTERHYTDREGKDRTSLDVAILDWHFVGVKDKDEKPATADSASAPVAAAKTGKLQDPVNVGSEDDLPL